MGQASCGLCGCAALRSASFSSRPRVVERDGLYSREVTIFLCWAVFNTLDLVTRNKLTSACPPRGRSALAEPKIALEEQNAIKLVPAAYVRRKGCEVGLDPLVARGRRRRSECYMSDVAYSRAGSKGVRGTMGFVWKSRPQGRLSQGDKA